MALFPIDHPIWPHLSSGHTVVTVNRRLARVLAQEYAEYCHSQNMSVWETPRISPVSAWFESAFSRLSDERDSTVLITASQAAALWEQVIEDDLHQHGIDLLQVPVTVRQVMRAHALCCDYLIDTYACDGVEQEAFYRWRKKYLQQCCQQGWVDSVLLPQKIDLAVAEGRLAVEAEQLWLGFDELPPVLQRFQQTLQRAGCVVQCLDAERLLPQTVDAFCLVDEVSELHAAAQWARRQLEQQVGIVAVVVPDLQRLHADVERIFSLELSRSLFPDRVPMQTFNISLGKPLAEQGMIAAALTLLHVQDALDFEQISFLLRCPWFRGGHSQWQQQALFEWQLRQDNVLSLSCSDLLYRLHHSPHKTSDMILFAEQLQQWLAYDDAVSPAVWLERINLLLQQVGWPGEAPLDSRGYQVFAAWQEKVLSGVGQLGLVKKMLTRSQVVSWIGRLCREILFQPKAQDQRLQIIGVLETAGLTFDALWLCGANERTFPGGLAFNPFLPVTVQKQHQMPHSDLSQEARYAKLLLERLQQAAARVVISYAQSAAELSCRVSPYLTHLSWRSYEALEPSDAFSVTLEQLNDHHTAALTEEQLQQPIAGGTALLKEQIHCPFKAFIHYRLGVRGLELPQPGLTSRRRGDLVHRVLLQVWSQLACHEALLSSDLPELRRLVAEQVTSVLDATRFTARERMVLGVETLRLQSLVMEWLAVERKRQPFAVQNAEEKQLLEVGPLRLTTIPDRVDVDERGRMIVLDYKTGQVTASDLTGDVLLEPQLPLYALYGVDGSVAAVSFALVRHGACGFKGVAMEDQLLPKVSSVEKSRTLKAGVADWDDLLENWRLQIESAADDVAAGVAAVSPVHQKVCQFCDLKGLCRIDLQGRQMSEEEDA
nr:PD-(D/E)XK nuclease family protein [uncultured Desulfuromonas sp.]